MKESDLLLKNSHQLENGLQSYHGEQKRGYHLNHLSIKNYIRNWCQKWCCILFGAIYRENKQCCTQPTPALKLNSRAIISGGFSTILFDNHVSYQLQAFHLVSLLDWNLFSFYLGAKEGTEIREEPSNGKTNSLSMPQISLESVPIKICSWSYEFSKLESWFIM